MVVRITLAGVGPEMLAARAQQSGIEGTVFQSWGTGKWGIEEGATLESTVEVFTGSPLRKWVHLMLLAYKQEAAYITFADTEVGTRAYLLWNDDRGLERIG